MAAGSTTIEPEVSDVEKEAYFKKVLASQKVENQNRQKVRISEESEAGAEDAFASAVTGVAGKTGGAGEEYDARDPAKIANALRHRLDVKRASLGALAASLKAEYEEKKAHVYKRYRQIKRAIRVVKAVSLLGTSLGDVFVSLTVLFLSINGEFLLQIFLPGYKVFDSKDPFSYVDMALFFAGWLVIFLVLLTAAVLYYMIYQLGIGSGVFNA